MRVILTLVRHGESTDNLKSLWAGWRDANLSNHGMNQAQRLAKSLESYPIKAIIASDLTRARWTAEQIRDHNKTIPAASFTTSDLLREQNFGKGEGQPWQQAQWQRKSGRDFKFEDGESLHDVAARAENVIVSYPKLNFEEYQLT
ncbi:phosphoglycerate mutase-like protein [Wallemia mellicola]|nr:phosphoglycerate mutase-like protein [Wallemia mellicola]